VFAIPFDVAIFSNLTRDHLDYHKTMEEYFASKRILFEGCGTDAPRVAVVNQDDEYGRQLMDFSRKKSSEVFTYGLEKGDFRTQRLDISSAGNRFDLVTPTGVVPLFSPMRGRVNVYNVLAASAAAYARGCSLDQIAKGVGALARVPGRFESVDEGQPFSVVVDYAHTDDALKNLTALAREFVAKAGGQVITVFGCGGDRDRAKRPLMGEAAGKGSNFVVLTSDNPRSEDPLAIMNDALPGLQRTHTPYALEPDRRKAIAKGLSDAQAEDIVLIAGKGHERTQTTREGVVPFDDFEVAREELRKLGYQK
jgi:UDP-N-acetylmuramoyl-L-alanyl-D-glutamate--2,6-diaminopimelate ligase